MRLDGVNNLGEGIHSSLLRQSTPANCDAEITQLFADLSPFAECVLRGHTLGFTATVVIGTQIKNLLHVVTMFRNKFTFVGLLQANLFLNSSGSLQISRILHVHLCAHKSEHIATTDCLLRQLVTTGLSANNWNPMLLIYHFKDLVAVCFW